MFNLNQVIIGGYLSRDPELKYTPSGVALCNFNLATNHHYKDQSGQNVQEVSFIECLAMGRSAELINQYLKKGSALCVIGRIKQEAWQDNQDNKKSRTRVIAESIKFETLKKDQKQAQTQAQPQTQTAYQAPQTQATQAYQAPQTQNAYQNHQPQEITLEDDDSIAPF